MAKSIGKTEKNGFDLKRWHVVVIGLLLIAVKLAASRAQYVLILAEQSPLDDGLMYRAAVSIASGEWLGAYDWLTLSKQSFFALWLAGMHVLKVPFLLGGQLLWALAALCGALALAPVLKKRILTLLLFAVLLFCPSSLANPAPLGYITRVYRDNIFPALCLLCIAGMLGFAFRYTKPLRRSVWWLALAGLALGGACLTREDGWWLLPFVVGAAILTGVFVWRQKVDACETPEQAPGPRAKALKTACLLLPLVIMLAANLAWRGANYAHYGRFITTDFSSGEFADAYGALTRISHENWDPKVAVPLDVREKLYAVSPLFAELRDDLEGDWFKNNYRGDGDYTSGAFYWALREAAQNAGHYDTPAEAERYFSALAAEVNALCDTGALLADRSPRSSVSPPFRGAYIAPVLGQTAKNLVYCATFQACDPRAMFSHGGNDPAWYEEWIKPMEEFLHEKALTATMEGSDEPYFDPVRKLVFWALDIVRAAYAVLLPSALAAALAWQVWAGARMLRVGRSGKETAGEACADAQCLLWLAMLGVLLCILLRAAMIAYVDVSSFTIGAYVMYLASIHPLMVLYGFVGTVLFARTLRAARQTGAAEERA